ncbi:MAG TPA: phage tail sheath C-terminal domain-containing protein [Gemmatimonadales bacterium]|nr:phage tail sheath C-terminal domain-containing protein [Gemmatimonadales bacterium]
MPNYSAPDIYVEEISSGPRPIGAVGTSTAAFVGRAPNPKAYLKDPRALNNWSEFLKEFGGDNPKSTDLSHAVFGFFQNGGTRCFVVNTGDAKTLGAGLATLESVDEVAIVATPGACDAMSYQDLLTHCEKMNDRVAIFDPPEMVNKIDQLTEQATAVKEGEKPSSGLRPPTSEKGLGAFYFPRILVRDPLSDSTEPVAVPPSGHLAGIWARTDATRGVHKAPANEVIRGALNVTRRITRAEQEVLNPAGVNCIRFFPAEGIRVWGARTVAPEASEWRYLNVRRLFNMIEESIAKGTRWVVFEPNDRPLWQDIRRDAGAFLRTLWRDGALMGRTAEEAFFVKCDDETNPQESIDQGRVIIQIGIAPVKPAEFIIFRIGQHSGGVEIQA